MATFGFNKIKTSRQYLFSTAFIITSPTGYTTTPIPSGWAPDLVQTENRLIFAVLFRL
ncbi:MAG: hypothetical protein JST70_01265 [Bacteroidetes bacterium]|nr:hypothetical protein [Bacteroidota bacterium]